MRSLASQRSIEHVFVDLPHDAATRVVEAIDSLVEGLDVEALSLGRSPTSSGVLARVGHRVDAVLSLLAVRAADGVLVGS